MRHSLFALVAVAVSSISLLGCFVAPGSDVGESSAAATNENYQSPRGRTFRVRNTYNIVLERVSVAGPRGSFQSTLQGNVAPGGVGTFRVPDSSNYNACELTLRFTFANSDDFPLQLNGCRSSSTISTPGPLQSQWGPSSDGDSKSGSSSSSGSSGSSKGGGDPEPPNDGDDDGTDDGKGEGGGK
jgi:uncharacterized membrane protein YgcG